VSIYADDCGRLKNQTIPCLQVRKAAALGQTAFIAVHIDNIGLPLSVRLHAWRSGSHDPRKVFHQPRHSAAPQIPSEIKNLLAALRETANAPKFAAFPLFIATLQTNAAGRVLAADTGAGLSEAGGACSTTRGPRSRKRPRSRRRRLRKPELPKCTRSRSGILRLSEIAHQILIDNARKQAHDQIERGQEWNLATGRAAKAWTEGE